MSLQIFQYTSAYYQKAIKGIVRQLKIPGLAVAFFAFWAINVSTFSLE